MPGAALRYALPRLLERALLCQGTSLQSSVELRTNLQSKGRPHGLGAGCYSTQTRCGVGLRLGREARTRVPVEEAERGAGSSRTLFNHHLAWYPFVTHT